MPKKVRCAVILALPQSKQFWPFDDMLRINGMDTNWAAWKIIRFTKNQEEDWGNAVETGQAFKQQFPKCELTLVFSPLHGVSPSGNYSLIPPKTKTPKGESPWYDESELSPTHDIVRKAAQEQIFDRLLLFSCHGQLAVRRITKRTTEIDSKTMRVIAFASHIWSGDRTGSQAEVFLANGLPMQAGGKWAPKGDTWLTYVRCTASDIVIDEPECIGLERKRKESVEETRKKKPKTSGKP